MQVLPLPLIKANINLVFFINLVSLNISYMYNILLTYGVCVCVEQHRRKVIMKRKHRKNKIDIISCVIHKLTCNLDSILSSIWIMAVAWSIDLSPLPFKHMVPSISHSVLRIINNNKGGIYKRP